MAIETEVVQETPEGFKQTEIGLLPTDWAIVSLGEVLKDTDVRARQLSDGELPVLSLTKNHGLIPQTERFGKRIATADVSNYKIIRRGQIVYNPYVIWEGAVHALRGYDQGLVSPVYPVWEARSDRAEGLFVDHLLRMPLAITAYNRLAAGAVNRRRAIRKKDFLSIQIPLPPLEEQRAIAHVLSTIQRAIEATDKVIAAARHFKRSFMRHLFTYGPVPLAEAENVPLKETEIGPVPEHWELARLGEVLGTDPQNGLYKPLRLYGAGTLIIRINDFDNDGQLVTRVFLEVQLDSAEVARYQLNEGDILLNRVNSLPQLGKVALIPAFTSPTVFESNMMRFRVDETRLDRRFAFRFLCSRQARGRMREMAKRAVAQSSISQGDVKSLHVPAPPLEEQRNVADALDSVGSKIDAEEKRKATLRELFRTMLHLLMTGQVRLPGLRRSPGRQG